MLPTLTDREITTLKMLAKGKTYLEVGYFFGIRNEKVHAICQQIRKKTGITDTKNRAACAAYVFGIGKEIILGGLRIKKNKDTPTQGQMQIMLLRAKYLSQIEIAKRLGLCVSTVANALSMACKRARIRPDPDTITTYLQENGVLEKPDPMDDPFFN